MQLFFTLFVVESDCKSLFLEWERLLAPIAEEVPDVDFACSCFFVLVFDSFAFSKSLPLDFLGTSIEKH